MFDKRMTRKISFSEVGKACIIWKNKKELQTSNRKLEKKIVENNLQFLRYYLKGFFVYLWQTNKLIYLFFPQFLHNI